MSLEFLYCQTEKNQVALIFLYVAVKNNEQKGLPVEFILSNFNLFPNISSNATKAGTQGWKQKPQKSTAHCLTLHD